MECVPGTSDRGAYFAVYADTLTCWYNEAGLARAAIEGGPRGARFRTGSSATMIVDSLTIVRGDDSDVMLVDEGRVLSQGSERAHRKLIVMRRVGGAWRIVVEVSPSRHSCWHDLPAGFGALSANPVSAARPARPARRAPARGSCRVTRIEAGCEDSAGTPPCRAVRTPDDAPPVRPGADRREALAALAEYAEGVNCELSPSFGPTGRISRLDGHCMGVGGTSWVYEGCD
jgi:hypothetical protein